MIRISSEHIIKQIGRIYSEDKRITLIDYYKKLDNYYSKENSESKEEFLINIVNLLYSHRILEVAKYNMELFKNINIVNDLYQMTNDYIDKKTEKVDKDHLELLRPLSKKIDIMLIKGMAIRYFYPEEYKRNQGDIDIQMKNFNDIWDSILFLEDKYYFEKLKLHFLCKGKSTATIDLLPLSKDVPFIDIHLTPYYMWGAVAYFDNIWSNSTKIDDFYIPSVSDLILMLCSHISNQWMYRMRDINDLYCIIKNNTIDWSFVIKKSKELGIYSILKILMCDLIDIYEDGLDTTTLKEFFKPNSYKISELLFKKNNYGKESAIGSIFLEWNFVFKNYMQYYGLIKSVYFCLKNSYYMITTHNRAFCINNRLKSKKENEVYVLKKSDCALKSYTQSSISSGMIICNEGTESEFFRTNIGDWKQVSYKS